MHHCTQDEYIQDRKIKVVGEKSVETDVVVAPALEVLSGRRDGILSTCSMAGGVEIDDL